MSFRNSLSSCCELLTGLEVPHRSRVYKTRVLKNKNRVLQTGFLSNLMKHKTWRTQQKQSKNRDEEQEEQEPKEEQDEEEHNGASPPLPPSFLIWDFWFIVQICCPFMFLLICWLFLCVPECSSCFCVFLFRCFSVLVFFMFLFWGVKSLYGTRVFKNRVSHKKSSFKNSSSTWTFPPPQLPPHANRDLKTRVLYWNSSFRHSRC